MSKGPNLATTNTWLDCTGKIQNFSVYNKKQRNFFNRLRPHNGTSLPKVNLDDSKTGGKCLHCRQDVFHPELALFKHRVARKGEIAAPSTGPSKPKRHTLSPGEMSPIDLAHFQCGHAGEAHLKRMFDFGPKAKLSPCDGCNFGKNHKAAMSSHSRKIRYFMDEAHTDCWGPASVMSYYGKRYMMAVVEIASKSHG